MVQAVSELEPAFLGGMAVQAVEEHKPFYFCMLHRTGAAFCQHELQNFAENFRVSAIFASRRQLWAGAGSLGGRPRTQKKGTASQFPFDEALIFEWIGEAEIRGSPPFSPGSLGPLRVLEDSVFSPLFGSLAELRSFARVIESGATFATRLL